MANPHDRQEAWRRFDEEDDFRRRAGALDRRWGYGARLAPQGGRPNPPDEWDYPDPYNAPDYWLYRDEWGRPGPYTGLGPRGYQRSDERIFEDVCERLTQHAQIDAREIEVQVEDGEVTLTGDVEDRRIKRMVELNAEMIPGVIDVHNELHVRRPETRMQRARRKLARRMADKAPGGPTPSGPAGY